MIRDAASVDEVFDHVPPKVPVIEPEVLLDDGAICVVMPESGELESRFRYDDGYWVPLTPR